MASLPSFVELMASLDLDRPTRPPGPASRARQKVVRYAPYSPVRGRRPTSPDIGLQQPGDSSSESVRVSLPITLPNHAQTLVNPVPVHYSLLPSFVEAIEAQSIHQRVRLVV